MLPHLAEPAATALLLALSGALLLLSALFSRASGRVGVPMVLAFLVVGVAAGVPRTAAREFADYAIAFRIGVGALVLILFDGGLNTSLDAVRQAIRPAAVLATFGVVGTAGIVALTARGAQVPWETALLLGAVISSTDAAAVFSTLRASGVSLKRRVGTTLEVESGINDPLAVILTVLLTENLLQPLGGSAVWHGLLDIVLQVAVGAIVGYGVGRVGVLVARVRFPASGLYPVVTLALAFLAFGVATLLHGSGFLAVYLCALLLGNQRLPYATSLRRVHDAAAWLGQIAMFLLLGLLVRPARLIEVAPVALGIAIVLAVVARPVVVMACLAPFRRYTPRDSLYVGWVGLRGAVPIVLATYPVWREAPGADWIFHVVFFIVVVNGILPGATVPWMTRLLDLESAEPARPPTVLEIESSRPLAGELASYFVDEALPAAGTAISELPFPEGSSVALVVRGDEIIAPRGATVLMPGDYVFVRTRPGDRALLHLIFGRSADE